MSVIRKCANYIKINHPYLAQAIFEIKANYRIKQHRTDNLETRKIRLAKLYKKYVGFDLSWTQPKRYTEKIQHRKLLFKGTVYSFLSDKYAVREWVESKIGAQYLIPLLGVWNSFDEIDFSSLPNEFVLKTNNASGTNVIVHNKEELDMKLLRRKLNYWMHMDYANFVGYEMHYSLIKPKIIAEQLIKNDGALDLQDYKFLCFDGKVHFIWVDTGRYHDHKRTIFNLQWEKQEWRQSYYQSEEEIKKPENLEKMIEIATVLAQGFDHVRVDLYNSDGKIYFGEMTFTNSGGFEKYYPDAMDYKLGALWNFCNRDSLHDGNYTKKAI